ncbi:MAG: siderophore-interacting protein [Pseudomonadota bacterium]
MRKKPAPITFDVVSTELVTPNMRRVSLGGNALDDFPSDQDGGYLKLMIPAADESDRDFVRTYTISRQRPDRLDIDFALHGADGEGGPAVAWSQHAKPGDQLAVNGTPGPAKPLPNDADWYLVIGDMTALPAITVNLAALPSDATGVAVIEIQDEDDRQDLAHPEGVDIQWVVNPHPGAKPDAFEKVVRDVPWREGQVYAWSATEFEAMRRIRTYLRNERGLGPKELYISSYWKAGLNEDRHREVKQADADAPS